MANRLSIPDFWPTLAECLDDSSRSAIPTTPSAQAAHRGFFFKETFMPPEAKSVTPTVFYRTLNVEGLEIFYREAGPRDAPTVLLLHGSVGHGMRWRSLERRNAVRAQR